MHQDKQYCNQTNEYYKYLGVSFTSNFRFNCHIQIIIAKAYSVSYAITSIMFNHFLEPKFRHFIYKVCIRPIMLLCAG